MRYELAASLGRNIATWRNALGVTQEQLANSLDIDPVTISRFERGATLPSLPTLQRVAQALGVTMAQLLSEPLPAKFSKADKIAALLEPLSESEQDFAVEFVERYCGFLGKRKQGRSGED